MPVRFATAARKFVSAGRRNQRARRTRYPALLLLLLLLAGCATPRQFAQPDPTWRKLTGQLRYQAAGSSVIGDVVLRTQGEQLQLDFVSGPGFPLMRWQQAGAQARAEGVLARGSWQGDVNRAPERLRGWAQLRQKFREQAVPQKLQFPKTDETFTFVFAP